MGIKGVFGVTKNGIPRGWRPSKRKFISECSRYTIMDLAKKYGVHYTTISNWKWLFGISDGRLKPKKIEWIVESNGCWKCTSHKKSTSNGYVYIRQNHTLISKILYEQKFGKIKKKGVCMLHKCDNRWCINPDHFFLGSKADNCRDRTLKGRQASGEQIAQHKLKEKDITYILQLKSNGQSYSKIANLYKVSKHCIWCVVKGITWKKVTNR
jgi:hypothetical protein